MVKTDVFISVIVPVYNVEKYLDKCIKSLLNQTFNNYEIILINDGSTDKSGEICNKYFFENEIVKVVHLINGGVSRARNKGLELAKGNYICFVDSDDWVEEDYLIDFVNNIEDENSFLIQNAHRDLPFKVNYNFMDFKNDYYELNNTQDIINILKNNDLQSGYPWNKFYSRKKICDNYLRFDINIELGEDEKFNFEYYKLIKKVIIINKANYHYTYNPDSATNQKRSFEQEIIRLDFRSNFYTYLLEKHKNKQLECIVNEIMDNHFKLNIYDRLYKNEKNRISRLKKLKIISELPKDHLELLKSKSKIRNIDYWLLKNKKVVISDFFKKLRISLNK